MDTVKVGIVGCGVIGPAHIESYQKLDGVEVRWVCDLQEDRAGKRASEFGIANRTTDVQDLLKDPELDAISVCTDHGSHAQLVSAALDAGKHVLCEKALSSNKEGLDTMMRAHKRNGHLVFSGIFQHRFDQAYRYAKELIETNAFGTLLTCSLQMSCLRTDDYYRSDPWRGTWENEGGGVLINQAIHYVDILGWLTGGISEVRGCWANLSHGTTIETEDTVVAALSYQSGALGTIEATSSSTVLHWDPRISIRGTTGMVELRDANLDRIVFADKAQEEEIGDRFRNCKDKSTIKNIKDYYGEGHPANIADFVQAIRTGKEPIVTGESARHAVDVVLGVYESQAKQEAVALAA